MHKRLRKLYTTWLMTAMAQFKLKNRFILSEKVEEMHEGMLFHCFTTADN